MVVVRTDFGCKFLLLLLTQEHFLSVLLQPLFSTWAMYTFAMFLIRFKYKEYVTVNIITFVRDE